MRLTVLGVAAFLASVPANCEPLVGPWSIENPTTVAVLGTPHLSGIEHLNVSWFEPLLDRLADWKPEVITIEALSGPECLLLRTYEKSWPDTADNYCARIEKVAAIAATATGLDMPTAEAASEAAVAKLGPTSTAAERRRMAALFAAAGNLGSATVQWFRLGRGERKAADGLTPELVRVLDEMLVRRNENSLIGAALAARLGLERIYAVDDHLSDRIQADAPAGLGEALTSIRSGPRPPLMLQARRMEKALGSGETLLTYYRFLNRDDVGESTVRADMGRAFVDASPGRHGRRYVAWWEARNLRMVANIRSALGARPGSRALVIVGATHKPYFDAYLSLMHEIRIQSASGLLGT